ncbi:unnamed protein product [Polarella glacialis]|uniref:Uncharacterized protein n=1 Tax=Polarella glacialis TaxID=89957 RepID=A0A813GIC9_POLGL|nr:unnamed protein product [Polarella glacialis]
MMKFVSGSGTVVWNVLCLLTRRCFALDTRSLAASRVLTALVLLYEANFEIVDWEVYAFLTDAGLWNRRSLLAAGLETRWSLHMVSGTYLWSWFLHRCLMLCSLLLLVGWHTRRATFGCWMLWISYHNRCTVMSHAFDFQLG